MFEISKYVYRVLLGGNNAPVVQSWGAHDFKATQNGLRFEVQGFQFTGTVEIICNEGCDLFQIDLNGETQAEGVYIEDLVGTVDRLVEKGNMTDEEYKAAVVAHYERGMCEMLRGAHAIII